MFVHGGPVPPQVTVRPPRWPAYRAYGSLAAHAGAVGVVSEHGYGSVEEIDRAAEDVERSVRQARQQPAVDPDRVLLWFYSGGGVLAGPWLADPRPWLTGVALTYPVCAHFDDVDTLLVTPVEAAGAGFDVPVLLTRVEHERDWIVPSQQGFLDAARASGADVEVIDVPGAEHGFETMQDTDAARSAITAGLGWARARLTAGR